MIMKEICICGRTENEQWGAKAKQLPIKLQLMTITINLSRAFFILKCSYALFSTFRGSLRADCIEQFNL